MKIDYPTIFGYPFLDEIILQISNNFELIFSITLAIAIMFIVLVISIYLSVIPLKEKLKSMGYAIFSLLTITGLIFVILLTAYAYWENYHSDEVKLSISEDLHYNASWVRQKNSIYFLFNNQLKIINANGTDEKVIYEAQSNIQSYHFSPDKEYTLIVSDRDFVLFNNKTHQYNVIDSIADSTEDQKMKGVISTISWAPDSRQFCYKIARWSPFSSRDNLYVYNLTNSEKREIFNPTRKISKLYWDERSENIYYLKRVSLDTEYHAHSFDIRVVQIPIQTLKMEMIDKITTNNTQLPIDDLSNMGITLFLEENSFSRSYPKENREAKKGVYVGIDKNDYLYYVPNKWFRKRLFKVSRSADDDGRYQFRSGSLNITQVRWMPGNKYIFMEHRWLGALILDPNKFKIGRLTLTQGHTFGWIKQ